MSNPLPAFEAPRSARPMKSVRAVKSVLFTCGVALVLILGVMMVGLTPFSALADETPPQSASNSGEEATAARDERAQRPQEISSPAGRMMASFGGTTTPAAIRGPIQDGLGSPSWGPGWVWEHNIDGNVVHWLGVQKPADKYEWCVNFDSPAPSGLGTAVPVSPRPPSPNPDIAAMQVTDNAQMGFIIEKYLNDSALSWSDRSAVHAAMSAIIHLSYERGGGVDHLPALEQSLLLTEAGRTIRQVARDQVAYAKRVAGPPVGYATTSVAQNRQDITVRNIGVKQRDQDRWLGNIPVSVTITSGNGVFEGAGTSGGTLSEDGLSWSGRTTASGAVELAGHSTANGEITVEVTFEDVPFSSVEGLQRTNGTQDTIALEPSFETVTLTTPPKEVVRDFQPMLTSSVANAGYSRVAAGTGVLRDELTVFADPSYEQPKWLGVDRGYPGAAGYQPLPVQFRGTAYQLDAPLDSAVRDVPADAIKVAETTFVAEGPGTYTAEATYSGDAGFITWVWEVDRDDQPHLSVDERNMIAGDWADRFGLEDETTTVVDFQPMLKSDTDAAASKLLVPGAEVLRDELTVFADPDYRWTQWLGKGAKLPSDAGYQPLPVKFRGVAYDVGERPTGVSPQVPPAAVKVAEAIFVAEGPGVYTVETSYSGDPGFVTWVWKVDKDDQPHLSASELQTIRSDWADSFGVAAEHTSIQWPGKIESNVKVYPTNDNTYLVDDVWLSGMPSDHPDFSGGHSFAADTETVQQHLYFWPDKTIDEVESLDDAVLIGSVDVPARNGFHPSVGGLEFKLERDDEGKPSVGAYQFVHQFVGDDRVAPFQSQVPDVTEMYEVAAGPQIGTDATGSADNLLVAAEDVTITDEVCYLNLTVGERYELSGVLVDQETAEPLQVDGRKVQATTRFTPDTSEGCVEVEFVFDSSALAGRTLVVFEDLLLDGVTVATHADIEDEAQTIYVPEIGTTATSEDGGKTVEAASSVAVVDQVCYANLVPDREYRLEGVMMDKSSGSPLDDGEGKVASTVVFTPEAPDGCVDMEFTFDSADMGGLDLVVFEDLYHNTTLVARHAEIDDAGQTVRVNEDDVPPPVQVKEEEPPLPATGVGRVGWFALGATLVLGGAGVLLVRRKL